jgi:hypothetical protein
VELIAAHPLLAGAEQVRCLKPLVQRHMALFKNGPDLDRELLPAVVALPDAHAAAGTAEPTVATDAATLRADRAIRPQDAFQHREGRGVIVEMGLVENAHGWLHQRARFYT